MPVTKGASNDQARPGDSRLTTAGHSEQIRLMRSVVVPGLVVLLFGCAEVVAPGGSGGTGGQGATGGQGGSPPPELCDADDDGFFHPHPACDEERAGVEPDCNDERADVFPGAPVICNDGAVNGCVPVEDDVRAMLGIAEAGPVANHSVFLSSVGGFFNNVDIAVDPGDRTTAFLATSESASIARLLEVELADPSNPNIIDTAISGASFANNDTGLAFLGARTFRLGTLARSGNDLTPAFSDFAPGATNVTLAPAPLDSSCPGPGSTAPLIIRGMGDDGTYYFELAYTATEELLVGASQPDATRCRSLVAEGFPFSEFGSQLIATGSMAIGRAPIGVWTWEGPFSYDDLFAYETSAPVTGAAAYLSRNNAAGIPVLMAFRSTNGLTVEAMDCSGREPCRPGAHAAEVPVAGEVRDVSLAPLGRGAALVSGIGADFTSPVDIGLGFIAEDGLILNGARVIPLATVGDSGDQAFRSMDTAVLPPSAGAEFYELLVALAVDKPIADQNELRLIRAVACQNE